MDVKGKELDKEALEDCQDHNPSMPGKFEGEDKSTVYAYQIVMGGGSEAWGTGWDAILLNQGEKDYFEIDGEYIVIEKSEQGFVSGTVASQADIDRLQAEDAANDDND